MSHEQSISFNVNELGVILSALQLLETTDENRIAKEYTSVPTLHDRLQSIIIRWTNNTSLKPMNMNNPIEINEALLAEECVEELERLAAEYEVTVDYYIEEFML